MRRDGKQKLAFSLRSLLKPRNDHAAAHALYSETVLAARDPAFFIRWGVPDTVEGRFEVLSLRAFSLLHRLKQAPEAADIAQAYFDIMFDDLDSNLRELGVGDMSVGKKVKKLAGGFYGRVKAYDAALDNAAGESVMSETLSRFLFRDTSPTPEILREAAGFLRHDVDSLDKQPMDDLLAGNVTFLAVAPPGEMPS